MGSDQAVPAPVVVAVWSGDESVFVQGVPNRDVTADDLVDAALLKEAFAVGTHTPPPAKTAAAKRAPKTTKE